ncbi:MAG TPA: DNA polymerase III subunit alpha, partial [Candidatus Acidoferrum sp.]|nr:DNA polymerase III subunit alpha [Candidatus Acidoferrum sp.]
MSKGQAPLAASDYVHLHNHTHYSLLDGLQQVPQMLDRVKELGMTAVAMTDHGTMSGAIEFYKEAKARDIKPIIGIETYVAARTIADRDPVKDKARYHLILLAMNQQGLENLFRLSTTANLDGLYYKARIDHDLLEKYNEGIICLSACMGGELGDNFQQNQDAKAYEIAAWYKSIFGDRYYIEVQDHGHPKAPKPWAEQVRVNEKLFKLAKDLDLPAVVTCDAHYCRHEDADAHEILLCVQTGSNLSDTNRMTLKDFDLYETDPKDIIARWGEEHPEVITNTRAIAERCNVEFELGKILIPKFDVPEGFSEESYLQQLVYQGLANRYAGIERDKAARLSIDEAKKLLPPNVLDRAEYELSIIAKMGYNGYFLIVQDFINWGKDQGIVFGPGRGSSAGSIIAYSLRITDLEPLKYDLLFERFLNPDRISMPDIDIDIMDSRREEVIEYCAKKYGSERVANIVTFGKMAARAAVRDVARVLEVPYAEADRLSKMIPPPIQGKHVPLKKSIVTDPDLRREYESNPTSKKIIDQAIRLEGTIRSHGVHAAGVVIAPDELVKFLPLEMAQKGVVATQFPMGPVEELGLLKMDFLGLSNLTILKNALRIIKRVHQEDIDVGTLPLDDKATYELLARGDTTGVFQLESAGMKRYLKELQPSVFDDIIAMAALYRPGPMQFIDDFIARKHGRKKIEYHHQLMENALKNTYGILVYQEQVMQISKELCGFTGGQADTMRKAIGKKRIEVMQKMKADFIDGALKNSDITRERIENFWVSLEAFAAYCFPKAHAACYALIAYWTAYLKAHYPAAFMAALMTSDQDDTDRLSIEISECKHMGLEVQAPDINQSFAEFSVVPDTNQIRFGLNAVKNVGANAVEEILRAREEGEFTAIEDFARRVNVRIVNRKNLESLIKAGAFDRFADRSIMMHNLDAMLGFANKLQKEALSGQVNLFGEMESAATGASLRLEPAATVFSQQEMLQWERELLGLYLSSHPLDAYDEYLGEQSLDLTLLKPEHDGIPVTVGGIITAIRVIATKNGDKMAFVKIENKTGEIELIIFPKTYQDVQTLLVQDKIITASGKLNAKDRDGKETQELKVLADAIRPVTADVAQSYQPTGQKMALSDKPAKSRRGSGNWPTRQSVSPPKAPS